jgi:hypothetical protein
MAIVLEGETFLDFFPGLGGGGLFLAIIIDSTKILRG